MVVTKQILVSFTSISIFQNPPPISTKPPPQQQQKENPLIVWESPVYPQNIYPFLFILH